MPLRDRLATSPEDAAGGHVRLVHDFTDHPTPLPSCAAQAYITGGPLELSRGPVPVTCNRHRHSDPHHAGVVQVHAGELIVSAVVAWEAA